MRKRENTAPERLFRRLWHILRWMLAQYNPHFSCPRCGSKARVVVSGREEGRRTYRCLAATSSLTLTEDGIRGGTIAPLKNHNRR